MQFLGKNVATGVYIARSATVATVLASYRAMGMDIYGYSDTLHADSALLFC